MKALVAASLAVVSSTVAFAAAAQEPDRIEVERVKPEVKDEVPILAYAYGAAGVSARSIGAQGYGTALAASKQETVGGGGAMLYGSPIDRLTLVGDASRDVTGRFAPSGAVIVRLLGHAGRGFSLGALVKYKVEGFAGTGGDGDFESELEGGILGSYAARRLHLDLNAIAGAGLSDEGEVDIEGRARVGVDLDEYIRLGLDAQFRGRAHGTETLVGGRVADFASGVQMLAGASHFFGSITAGPSTTNVANGTGFAAVITFGATTL